jgi:hypothetical protein
MSLQMPLAGSGTETLTLEDLLPGAVDPADEAGLREIRALARRYAADVLPGLGRTDRIALLAVALDRPFNDPRVGKAARAARRTLGRAHDRTMRHVAALILTAYPDEDASSVRTLILETAYALYDAVRAWAETDPYCSVLLKTEGRHA